MIVDTSALVAILRDEPEARRLAIALANGQQHRMSAANFLEAAIVIDGSRDPVASRLFDDLLRESRIHIEVVTEEQARMARGHVAALNFGDCFAYALARTSGEPLLFKGRDFIHTGIPVASF
jgi:ribonuclease VapC